MTMGFTRRAINIILSRVFTVRFSLPIIRQFTHDLLRFVIEKNMAGTEAVWRKVRWFPLPVTPRVTVVIISTGGTIASPTDLDDQLRADDLVEAVSGLDAVANVETRDFERLPSTNLTLEHMYELAEIIRTLDGDSSVDGVVVTHGTDVLEESAYFADLCYGGETPVIFTGAMRNPSMAGPDGPANLLTAVRVASSERAHDLGVLVTLSDRVHAARDITKTHSTAPDTFRSPEFGPLAVVDHERVVWERHPAIPTPTYDPDPDRFTNDVLALVVPADPSGRALRAGRGSTAVCIAVPGTGNLPPTARDAVAEVRDAGVPVVAATRCQQGRLSVTPPADLRGLGCLYSDRDLLQTRIEATVALAADGLDEAFERLD